MVVCVAPLLLLHLAHFPSSAVQISSDTRGGLSKQSANEQSDNLTACAPRKFRSPGPVTFINQGLPGLGSDI